MPNDNSISQLNISNQDVIEESLNTPDSEFDDALAVPDCLEIHENSECVDIIQGNCQRVKSNDTEIYSLSVKFDSRSCATFIPGEDITVKIIDIERSVTTHPLNPNLYTIEFKHGSFVWTAKKRYSDIQHLHNQLKIFRASLNIPFPTRNHRKHRNSLKNLGDDQEKRRNRGALPRFPNRPESLVANERLPQRMEMLENYLGNLLKIEIYKCHPETIKFMELSRLSFIDDLGGKGREGLVLKRTGSGTQATCCFWNLWKLIGCFRCNVFCTSVWGTWHARHLVVKDTFVVYINPKDGTIKTVILMDSGFEVSSGMYSTGLKNALQIMNLSRHIVLKCRTRRKAKEWLEFLQNVANTEGKQFIQKNPHNSFTPYRPQTPATWYVDGSDYMAAVADALENASQEIFIADWWLSPEIHLKRPANDNDYWRLDKILQRRALQGVKVFVMIYKEVELALGLNSFYSKQKLLESGSENIKVFRHPDHARAGIFLWAHHEKIVVVDQTIAFLGGIDLCYGRWDNHEHRLTDLGNTSHACIYALQTEKEITTSSGRSSNMQMHKHVLQPLAVKTNKVALSTTKFLSNEHNYEEPFTTIPKLLSVKSLPTSQPQELRKTVKGDSPEFRRKNFVAKAVGKVVGVKSCMKTKRKERMNKVYSANERNEEKAGNHEVDHMFLQNSNDTEGTSSTDFHASHSSTGDTRLWLGKDYTNFIVKDFGDVEHPYQDSVDRNTTPRMPWHDIGIMVQNFAARDVARHFIQRWNAIKMEKAKLNPSYPFLLPKSYKNFKIHSNVVNHPAVHKIRCQVLRSVSSWSAGFLESETKEQSIHEAYIDAITNAKRYIYIENQFFISLATTDRTSVQNRIADTLLKRILQAFREKAIFRVFVVLPLLPGFEGQVGEDTGTALHTITHWNYTSISRGKDSIIKQLRASGIADPSEYITFHGLRTHSLLNCTMVTELIYVHSKLMIVDDDTVICGSANINDRSMIATRDSEIAAIIHDEEFAEKDVGGITLRCGKFAGSLRKHLFREHLGLLESDEEIELDNITDKSFYHDVWQARSKKNTEIFEQVFQCIPSDKVMSFAALKLYQSETPLCQSNTDLAQQLLADVKGHLVDLPLDFLAYETLTPAIRSVEGMLPTSLWV
ncbi:phospholipase D2-like isoform X2 [Venturia canescens]|uniref:phospholipase D2-like isoform X2 n=1 Tax=Venturia canescens TaxID=32260 RepID=UPI001C9CC388|nr:phospholipase D2-like isoform X2 [Venturia canescens]